MYNNHVDIVDQQPAHDSSSGSSEEGNSLINKACILTTPDTNGETTGRLRSSSENNTNSRGSKDQDQLSKMRCQLRAL